MRRHRVLGGWLAIVLVLAAVGLAGCGASTGIAHAPTATTVAKAKATATASVAVTPTVSSAGESGGFADPAALGWVRAGAPRSDAVAVAPGAPGTLAACSGATDQSGQGQISLSLSTDDGTTWQTQQTSIPLARCLGLAISPATTRSIALYAGTCRSDCGQGYERLYLTSDAGGHWTQVTPSQDGDTGGVFGWVGSAFFANTAPDGTPAAATQYLAASRDGVHFTWTSLPGVPGQLYASGSTLYALTGSSGACSASAGVCTDLYRSTDLGATWSRSTPTYQGNNVGVVGLVPASEMLLGFDVRAFAGPNTYPLLRSTDGGAMWQPLPNSPGGLQAATEPPGIAPDGTLYVGFCCDSGGSTATSGIYTLAPGGTAWTLASPVGPGQVHLVAVSWDAQGHPARLWGLRDVYPDTSAGVTDLWSHAA